MSFSQSLRTAVPLLIGLAIGGVGVAMFKDSLPGTEGTPEERANRAEAELKQAKNRILALEGEGRGRGGYRAAGENARRIKEDYLAGNLIDPDDILGALQPALAGIAPVLEKMRVRDERQRIDSMTGEFARRYDLTPQQQDQLKAWFNQRAKDHAKEWADLVSSPGTDFRDLARESRKERPYDGVDAVMEGMLTGDKLQEFKTARMAERADRVQAHADARVQRLDGWVGLDDTQRDQVFGIMARSSPDYKPEMRLEGIGGDIGATPGGDSREAIESVLRPDQRQAFADERSKRMKEATEEAAEIGMKLPDDFDPMDLMDF